MWAFVIYYVAVVIYTLVLLILKRPSVLLQFLILVSVPFAGIAIVAALLWNSDKTTSLPEWLIRRQAVPESDWLIPDKEKEKNIVPFSDALYLNSSLLRRQLLIDMLKNEKNVHQDVLKQALQNDDTETAHYAAVALQKSKSETMGKLTELERRQAENPNDVVTLYEWKRELSQAIELEFLDPATESGLRRRHLMVLSKIQELTPSADLGIYRESLDAMMQLQASKEELEQLALKIRTNFEPSEEQLLLLMKIAYLTKNKSSLGELVSSIRASSMTLSPQGLQQLRFWMQG